MDFLWALLLLGTILLFGLLLLAAWAIHYHISRTEIPPGIPEPFQLRCLHCLLIMGFGLVSLFLMSKENLCWQCMPAINWTENGPLPSWKTYYLSCKIPRDGSSGQDSPWGSVHLCSEHNSACWLLSWIQKASSLDLTQLSLPVNAPVPHSFWEPVWFNS